MKLGLNVAAIVCFVLATLSAGLAPLVMVALGLALKTAGDLLG
jgi:hypothetical protein